MLISPKDVKRAMQIKGVLLRAMNKEYSWLRAAEIFGDHAACAATAPANGAVWPPLWWTCDTVGPRRDGGPSRRWIF
jgi:hypothetical protein